MGFLFTSYSFFFVVANLSFSKLVPHCCLESCHCSFGICKNALLTLSLEELLIVSMLFAVIGVLFFMI